jgi:hypothetical protein
MTSVQTNNNSTMVKTTRTRVITSMLSMFKAEHGSIPAWLIELHHRADDALLLQRLSNWRQNYPSLYAAHGIYVM